MSVSRAERPRSLAIAAIVAAIFFVAPSLYVLWRVLTTGTDASEVWHEVPGPLWRTVQLAVLVSTSAAVLGTSLAWLLLRTDLPLRRLFRILAPVPLVFPSFVGAAAYLAGLAPNGVLRQTLELVGYHAPKRFRGLGASWLVLTLFTYPYVYLSVGARLAQVPRAAEESARLLGDSAWRMFARVVLPMIRRSVLGGTLLVFLYSLSEFGAVQLLGYDTLTRVVYSTRLVDRAQSFGAAAVLLVLAFVVVYIEHHARGGAIVSSATAPRPARAISLGKWRIFAFSGVSLVLFFALAMPVASLVQWAWRGISQGDDSAGRLGTELGDLATPTWTTAWLGATAGLLTVLAVLPAAILSARYRSRLSTSVNAAVIAGFAVPGLVIALSMAFWTLNVPGFDAIYQTVPLLLAAYVVHFGSQAMRATENSVAAVPTRVSESARLLGAGSVRRALTIDLPLMRPGLLAGGGLVLLATLKELPATLLLAPIGLETLSTRVWGMFEEGFLAESALAALALVVLSAVLTWILVLRRSDQLA
jgi:iron(III) transport system permease protein